MSVAPNPGSPLQTTQRTERRPARRPSALVRGLRALDILGTGDASAAELARRLKINRSTALRLLNELTNEGFVLRDSGTKRYALSSSRLVALVARARDDGRWLDAASSRLRELRDATGESTVVGVPASDAMVYVASFASEQPVAVQEQIGSVRPMHSSALGKAYLSALAHARLDRLVAHLPYRGGTAAAPRDPGALRTCVEQARKRGFAVDRDETFDGVSCVAVPLSVNGAVVAAAGISAPSSRLPDERLDMLGQKLIDAFRIAEPAATEVAPFSREEQRRWKS